MTDSIESRVTKVESDIAHLQHDLDSQNEVILENTQRLAKLENSINEIVRRLQNLKDQFTPEKRSFEDERPPHY